MTVFWLSLYVRVVWNFSVSLECDVKFLCENRVWVGQVKVLWNACGVWENRIGVSKCERSEWNVRGKGVQGRKPVLGLGLWLIFAPYSRFGARVVLCESTLQAAHLSFSPWWRVFAFPALLLLLWRATCHRSERSAGGPSLISPFRRFPPCV